MHLRYFVFKRPVRRSQFDGIRLRARTLIVTSVPEQRSNFRLDRGIHVAVALASVGVVFMGLLLGPLYAAASYGRAALLH